MRVKRTFLFQSYSSISIFLDAAALARYAVLQYQLLSNDRPTRLGQPQCVR